MQCCKQKELHLDLRQQLHRLHCYCKWLCTLTIGCTGIQQRKLPWIKSRCTLYRTRREVTAYLARVKAYLMHLTTYLVSVTAQMLHVTA